MYLEMKDISMRFGSTLALDKVSFSLEKGEIHGLMGENGAGKSTLMNILGGVYAPSEGKVIFDGKDIPKARETGVTTALICPGSANAFGGQIAAVKLNGSRVEDMILKAPVAMKMATGDNVRTTYGPLNKMPMTRMGVAAVMREAFQQTLDYIARKERGEHPALNVRWEALTPVVQRQLPIHIHAHRSDDIYTAMRVAREFGLELTVIHATDGIVMEDVVLKNIGEDAWEITIELEIEQKAQTCPHAKRRPVASTIIMIARYGIRLCVASGRRSATGEGDISAPDAGRSSPRHAALLGAIGASPIGTQRKPPTCRAGATV